MDVSRSIASALQIFVVFAFFSCGLFFFALPFLPEVRFELADFLLHRLDLCAPTAIIFFVTAFLLLVGFYGFNRGKALYVEMGAHTVSVEEALIRHSVDECFKAHFAQKIHLSDVEILWGKKLQIGISLSAKDPLASKEFLIAAERQLQLLLRQRFGYIKPFYLILKSN